MKREEMLPFYTATCPSYIARVCQHTMRGTRTTCRTTDITESLVQPCSGHPVKFAVEN